MKKLVAFTLLASATLGATQSFSQVITTPQPVTVVTQAPVTVITGGPVLVNPVHQWCNQAIAILNRSKAQANYLARMGHFAQSTDVLVRGLSQARGRSFNGITPLSQKVINRGIGLAATLRGAITNYSQRTVNRIMLDYYKFVVDSIEVIDLKFFNPNTGYADENIHDQFAIELLNLAGDQIALANTSLIVSDKYDNAVPIGNSAVYFKAMLQLTQNSLTDIRNSGYLNAQPCLYADLDSINSEIAQYLSGAHWMSEPAFVDHVYNWTKSISDELQGRTGCY